MSNNTADTIVILSSELIAEITEQYFNKTMFKRKVKIVDLKPTETGYMFSISFLESEMPAVVKGPDEHRRVNMNSAVADIQPSTIYETAVLKRDKRHEKFVPGTGNVDNV